MIYNSTCTIEYETSCRRILSHPSLPGIPSDISEKEKEVRVSSLIPLDSVNMVIIGNVLLISCLFSGNEDVL